MREKNGHGAGTVAAPSSTNPLFARGRFATMVRPMVRAAIRAAVMVVTVGFGALVVAGCPKNACFFQTCINGKCECSISSCVDGAEFDLQQNTCVCVEGRVSVQGQCLTQAAADAFCGKGYTYGAEGCKVTLCGEGQQRDEASGACVASADLAQKLGVPVGEGEKLGCPPGNVLVLEGDEGTCVPAEQACARDEAWNGTACVKVGSCPTGSAWNTATNQCVAYASSGEEVAVDVMRWSDANYGPNGGNGTAAFCNQFSRTPWRFGVPEGQSATVQVVIDMAFPGGQVNAGTVRTAPSYTTTSTPVPAKGAESVQASAQSIFSTLVMGGGKASAASAQTTVKCRIVNASKPLPVPATGGF
jgi:hypothetical protein